MKRIICLGLVAVDHRRRVGCVRESRLDLLVRRLPDQQLDWAMALDQRLSLGMDRDRLQAWANVDVASLLPTAMGQDRQRETVSVAVQIASFHQATAPDR